MSLKFKSKTTYEELEDLVSVLLKKIEKLEARIVELEGQIGKNSQNSSKPPSSDGFRKAKTLRPKGLRKSGAQLGHKGKTLEASKTPDIIVKHEVLRCDHCAADLGNIQAFAVEKRQVFDVPKPTLFVTEHQAERKTCPCCKKEVKAVFPNVVASAVQYGEGIKAASSYLHGYQLLPYARACEWMSDLYGVLLAEGTLDSLWGTQQTRARGNR